MRPTLRSSSGGARYPYPKEVWTPSGGWWTRPANWKSNTALVGASMVFICYGIWQYSAAAEVRHNPPTRWIPSMLWAKQFTSGKMGIKDEASTGSGQH